MTFEVPTTKNRQKTDRLATTVNGRGKNYSVWFDDRPMDESR